MTPAGTQVIPAVVIGGYLGAGKTTLVNHLLRAADGRRIAVLVNDFGEIAIDADLILGAEGGVLSLAGGCVCCTIGEDLIGALETLLAREPRPDLLLIETSGVGMPGAVAQTVSLLADLVVEGVVVLMDAETVRSAAEDRYVGDTVMRQLAQADLLLLNKTDLLTPGMANDTAQWLGSLALPAPIVETDHNRLPSALIFGPAGPGEARALHHHADEIFETGVFLPDGPVDLDRLGLALSDPACGILRAKGALTGLDGVRRGVQLAGRRWRLSDPGSLGEGLVWIARKNAVQRGRIFADLSVSW
ncbi:MAG: GTPase [Alphaproteobacteria bacterium PA2]|nr:MAG: GTPase [Alphaproteobacteria bacterium PA2]